MKMPGNNREQYIGDDEAPRLRLVEIAASVQFMQDLQVEPTPEDLQSTQPQQPQTIALSSEAPTVVSEETRDAEQRQADARRTIYGEAA